MTLGIDTTLPIDSLRLCNRVVPTEDLVDEAIRWAEELAAKSPLALRYAKEALGEAMESNLGETISNEARLQHVCITSEDFTEGVTAFLGKREPQWKGR